MKRLLVLFTVLIAGVVVAAFSVSSVAASIDGTHISQSALDNDLNAIANSSAYQCYLNAEVGLSTEGEVTKLPIAGAGQDSTSGPLGVFSATFVRFWLNQMIHQSAVQSYATSHGLHASSALTKDAQEEISGGINGAFSEASEEGLSTGCTSSGAAVLASLPASFVNELVADQTANDLVDAHSADSGLSPSAVRAYFESHRSDFETLCVHDLGSATQAGATTMRNELLFGAPLATVAKSSVVQSTVPTSGGNGCVSASNDIYALVARYTKGLKPGGVSQPFANGSDYFIFQLDSVQPVTYSQLPALLVQESIINAGETRASTTIDHFVSRATVTIDPRYGTWTRLSPTEGVFAPLSPPPALLLSATADNPPAVSTASTPPASAGGG
jgi:hypothetical protein